MFFFGLLFLDLSELGQRLGNTLLTLLGGAQTSRAAASVTGLWVSVDFALKRFDLCLGFLQTALKCRAADDRRAPQI